MTAVIKLKRGTTTPTTGDITSGEVAVDTSAQKFYINDSGTIKSIGDTSLSDLSITSTAAELNHLDGVTCLLYTSPSPRDRQKSRMPSSA